MAEHLIIKGETKEELYATLLPQLKSLVEGESDIIAISYGIGADGVALSGFLCHHPVVCTRDVASFLFSSHSQSLCRTPCVGILPGVCLGDIDIGIGLSRRGKASS